jgi:DNA-binding NarL/FixJ family response regulator
VPDQRIVILTSFDDRQRVYRATCNGTSRYLLKTADPVDILLGIRDVMNGSAALSKTDPKTLTDEHADPNEDGWTPSVHPPGKLGKLGKSMARETSSPCPGVLLISPNSPPPAVEIS